jgi:hypothetical protein
VPLRPVSELGLMEVTDLASRDHYETAAASPETGARSTRAKGGRQTGRRNAKATGGRTTKTSGRPQSGTSPTPKDSVRAARRKTPSGASAPKDAATPTTPRPASDSRKAHSASAESQVEKQGSLVAKIGIPVMSSAIGVAGGLLLTGKGLQRRRKSLRTSRPTKVDIDLARASARIGKAGRRVGNLAGEMRDVRERTEQLARALGYD